MNAQRLLASALTLCAAIGIAVTPVSSAPSPYTIEVILPLTGQEAFSGQVVADALRVYENYANRRGALRGQPIHFNFNDDQSVPQVSVQLATLLIAKNPAVVIGPERTANCSATMPLFKDGPVMYCFSPAIFPPRNGYVFSAGIPLDQFVLGMVRYLRLRGWTRIGIVSSTDATGQADDTATRQVLALPENAGLQIVSWEHFNPADLNLTAQASHVKAAGAQAVIAWVSGPAFGTLLRSLHDLGIDLPLTTTSANSNATQLQQYVGFLPTVMPLPGLPFLAPDAVKLVPVRKAIAEFLGAYRTMNMTPSPAGSSFAWDIASIVVSGLRKLGPDATAAQLKDYILGLRDFVGVNGVYNFGRGDQHGLSDQAVVMLRWDPKTSGWTAVSGLGGVPR